MHPRINDPSQLNAVSSSLPSVIYALPTPVPNPIIQSPGIICPNAVLIHYHDNMLKQKQEDKKTKRTRIALKRERKGVVVAPP